jgi:NAD+ synthase (glutamine-hydrolysing)
VSGAPTAPFGFFRVAAACPRVSVADPDANVAEILKTVAAARAKGAQALVLPELSLTGYTCGDLFFNRTLIEAAERALVVLLKETAAWRMILCVGLPLGLDGRLFNCAAVLQAGRILGIVPKSFLPGYREYYEERWFSSSREAVSDEVRVAGQEAPFGTDMLFELASEPQLSLASRSARTCGRRSRPARATRSRAPRCS